MECSTKELSPSDLDASTSGSSQSRGDQELLGCHAMSKGRDPAHQTWFYWCSPHTITRLNLNPARVVLAEILGTFILIFSVSGIVASMKVMGVKVGLLEYAATTASAVVAIVFSIGDISGAHINPAITIAFAMFGHFPWPKVPFYVTAQMLGAISATYVGGFIYGVEPELLITHPIQGCRAAFCAEFMATFLVMFLAVSLAKNIGSVGHLSGFVMGLGIALGVLITGPISGGSMNPARSLAPAIVSWKFNHIWIYIVAPTAGAVLGVLMVHVLCPRRALLLDPNSSP
ncbi:hypothetical protein Ancab_013414 [Ancistrocladus abbreviatus]